MNVGQLNKKNSLPGHGQLGAGAIEFEPAHCAARTGVVRFRNPVKAAQLKLFQILSHPTNQSTRTLFYLTLAIPPILFF